MQESTFGATTRTACTPNAAPDMLFSANNCYIMRACAAQIQDVRTCPDMSGQKFYSGHCPDKNLKPDIVRTKI